MYMSEKMKKESHQPHEKSGSSHKGLSIIIILCFLGIMPVLIWVSLPETSPYTAVSTASPLVQTAAAAAGLQICSSDNYPVNIPGGQSAVLYKLSPDCNAPTSSTTVQILVVGFTSTDAMNAAIYQAQVTYQNWQTTNTAAFMAGNAIIVVQGGPGNQDVEEISTSLIDQGAARII